MTIEGHQVAQVWRDAGFAADWAQNDTWADMLSFPRRMATAIVGQTRRPRLVIDVASGPGDFLRAFLEAYSAAHGVWTDASAAMLEMAQDKLAPFADRVDYQLVDMTDLRSAALPTDADAVISSRASHHLRAPALHSFYRDVHDHLAPGGYVVNLDHTTVEEPWDQRYQGARSALLPKRESRSSHHHDQPSPTASAHFQALRDAGFIEADMPWKAFRTCMFVAVRGEE